MWETTKDGTVAEWLLIVGRRDAMSCGDCRREVRESAPKH